MLSWLKIRNYLLIDNLELNFPDEFVTITGETGAGKSVLIGAISLLTGKRADTSVLLDKSLKSVVEAGFDVKSLNLKSFFNTLDLDYEEECILRREITGQGKSRAFINDTPVRLEQLQELSDYLIDIHSQHQTLLLGQQSFQRNILDAVSGLNSDYEKYSKLYKSYVRTSSELEQLEISWKRAMEEKDFLEFQFAQLDDAQLQSEELFELEEKEKLLANAEDIKTALSSVETLDAEDSSIVGNLKEVQRNLEKIAPDFKNAEQYAQRMNSVVLELKDLMDSAQQDADMIEYDPALLVQVQERINLLNSLLVKHQKETVQELIDLRDKMDGDLNKIQMDNSKIANLRSEKEKLLEDMKLQAAKLTAKRNKGVPKLQKQLGSMLSELGMPDAVFKIDINALEKPAAHGMDDVRFLFSANPDLPPNEIHKVASGGEMSRLMLCLKSVVAEYQHLPSIIFDEIDTGVSGEVAGKMGEMMKLLSGNSQVFAITHLPQVAALGKEQFHVSKLSNNGQSRINIRCLETTERVDEIARMSSGKDITEVALQHAKNLLGY